MIQTRNKRGSRQCHLAELGLSETCNQRNLSSDKDLVEQLFSDDWVWMAYLNGDELSFCSLKCAEHFFTLLGFEVVSETLSSEKKRARIRVNKRENRNGKP